MALYRTEGVILRNQLLGEADRIVTIYTRERGKVRAVARGARRPRNRFVGSSQPFTLADFLIFDNKGLDNISQIEIKESFAELRDDLGLMARASYLAELLCQVMEEEEANPEIYRLLVACYYLLLEAKNSPSVDPDSVLCLYEAQLLKFLGYAPLLDGCMGCHAPLDARAYTFYTSLGGVLCDACRDKGTRPESPGIKVSKGTIETLKYLLNCDPGKLRNFRMSRSTKVELQQVLRSHIDFRLEVPLKSRNFLEHFLG
ncbi:MAG TPA: DNA repair protein RecO [Firmicutes bacterium]|nr:DNA repair protein RecO [Bacillota bacterium]